MQRVPLTLVLLTLISISSVTVRAAAAEPADNSPVASGPSDVAPAPIPGWSLGAGILGGSPTLLSSYYYLGTTLGVRSAPAANVSLERRLSNRYQLTLGFSASMTTFEDDASIAAGAMVVTESTSAGVSGGLRYVLNPGGAVEVSIFGAVTVGMDTNKAEDDAGTLTTNFLTAGLVAGLAIERKLLDNLYLRLQTTFLTGSYGSGEVITEEGGTKTTNRSSFLNGGLALSPGISLRMTF